VSSGKSAPWNEIDDEFLLKLFAFVPAAVVVLTSIGAIWIYFSILALLPDGETRIEIPGLISEVKAARDDRGMPLIIANNEEDLAVALGYVMAQDRLWQMDLLRRSGQGRLAEILGPEYLEGDVLTRSLLCGTPREQAGSDRERKWLDAFIKGINSYITLHKSKPSVEFSFLEYRPEAFTVEDVQSIIAAMAISASKGLRIDPVLTQFAAKLGDKCLPVFPKDPLASDPSGVAIFKNLSLSGIIFNPQPARFLELKGGTARAVGPTRDRLSRTFINRRRCPSIGRAGRALGCLHVFIA
jgi:acyl-homoserine lactone acylase PvdQ